MSPVVITEGLPADHFIMALAKKHGWRLQEKIDLNVIPSLFFEDGALKLLWRPAKSLKDSFFVDFLSKANRHSLAKTMSANQIFKKSLGPDSVNVLDMTGGYAGDALLMCRWGHKVTSVESQPVIYALTRDALDRVLSAEEDEFASKLSNCITSQLSYQLGDSLDWQADKTYSVVYIDPMFPEKKNSALSPKPMQVLHKLGVMPQSLEGYVQAAAKLGPERLIIKRPLSSPVLYGSTTHSFKGKSIRYDMYDKNFLSRYELNKN